MRFFILTFSVVTLFVQLVLAQKVIYVYDNETNKPIEGVNVSVNNIMFSSKINGQITINLNTEFKDSLVLKHLAYKQKRIYYPTLENNSCIYLEPAIIVNNPITVSSSKYETSNFIKTITLAENTKLNLSNITDIFKSQTSFFVKDYGAGASSKTISARGMSSENTVVLFNEAKINDLRTGAFDFNSISTSNIEKISIISGAESDNSFSSSGGVVKISTGRFADSSKAIVILKTNSEAMKSSTLSYSNHFSKLQFSLTGERAYSDNKYKYYFEDNEYSRRNAQYNKTYINSDLKYNLENTVIKFYSHYSYLKSGIPGAVVSNNDGYNNAYNYSHSFVSIMNINTAISANMNYSINAAYNYNKFVVADKSLFYPDSQRTSVLNEYQITNKFQSDFGQIKVSIGNFSQFSDLNDKSNINQLFKKQASYNRLLSKTFLTLGYSPNLAIFIFNNPTLYLSATNNYINEKSDMTDVQNFFTGRIGLTLPVSKITNLIVKANYSNDTREPSYSERFYSRLDKYTTNNLKNEDYRWFDSGLEYSFNFWGRTYFSAVYYKIDAQNKIVWVPLSRLPGLQYPMNAGQVNSSGIDISLQKEIPILNIQIASNYTYNKAINKNKFADNDYSYNKYLIYSPLHKFNFNLSGDYKDFHICYSNYFVSKRYFSTDNNKSDVLPHYFIHDIAISYDLYINKTKTSFGMTVYNLFNEKYFIIQSYPMPLRNFSFSTKLEF